MICRRYAALTIWIVAALSSPLAAQTSDVPVVFSIGSAKTAAEQAAIRLAIEYSESFSDIFVTRLNSTDPATLTGATGSLWDLSPDVSVLTGTEDSFSGIVAKLSGNYVRFHICQVGGGPTPCRDRTFHVVPVSVGLETDRGFNTINGLVEVGYVPFFRRRDIARVPFRIGAFLQAGYKFEEDTTATASPLNMGSDGGHNDSGESEGDPLLRLKGEFRLDDLSLGIGGGSAGIKLLGRAAAWMDLMNGEVYPKLQATARIPLGGQRAFDFTYERGSGAPNFNTGDQFSANLTLAF